MKTVLEVLIAGRAKIALEENFCQGVFAKDKLFNAVSPNHTKACSWCSEGVVRSLTNSDLDLKYQVLHKLDEFMEGNIPHFNDYHTHAEVLAKWDEVIALAKL